jgi:hypothetical protein
MKISRRSTIVASAVAVTVTGITASSMAAAVGSYASSNATVMSQDIADGRTQ